jgi:hypothetical protein
MVRSAVRLFGAAGVVLLSAVLMGCDVKEPQTINFDAKYHQALKAASALPDVARKPCRRDYRYQACFVELTGSAAQTMQRLAGLLEEAGFKRASAGSDSSELDATFVLEQTPYSVNTSFSASGIEWTAYEEGVGLVASLEAGNQVPPYAVIDPAEAATDLLSQLLISTGMKPVELAQAIAPCDSQQPSAGACVSGWTVDRAKLALVKSFFAGEQAWFGPLDRQPTFEYREEPLIQEMIAQQALKPGFKSSSLFRKVDARRYTFEDTIDWPAYRFEIILPGETQGQPFRVRAERRSPTP